MTTIDKVAICGIRSYDPSSLTVIKFFKPLTIILGNNGCGKTTIIESLKYVCSGDVPPLSERGRTFVHSPHHCSVNVVKACVKVAFKTRDNKPVIVNSSMQLTVKNKNKIEFKTIDGIVRMYDDISGQQIALSHKCADMKKVVPELMGVSHAILNNVIFCHQEDANWPLAEAKKLKEKFDEIFATSRWSKSLQNINQYRKSLNLRSKDLKNDLIKYETYKENADKLHNDLEQTKIRMAKYKKQSIEYNKKIDELINELKPLQIKHNKLSGFSVSRAKLETEVKQFRERAHAAHERMDSEYTETEEELRGFLEKHEKDVIMKQNEFNKETVNCQRLENELSKRKIKMEQLNIKRGQINQIISDHKDKTQKLYQRLKDLHGEYLSDNNHNGINQNEIKQDNPQIINSFFVDTVVFCNACIISKY